jgi:hypothetical protein
VIDIVVKVVDYASCISNLHLICIAFVKVFIKLFYEFQCTFCNLIYLLRRLMLVFDFNSLFQVVKSMFK